jgi:hypothetical protein
MEAKLRQWKEKALGPNEAGRNALLMRLFESQWFNEFMCLQYLFNSPKPDVEAYLCSRLADMPPLVVERYLLQLVYLTVSRPGGALERTLVALCRDSFPVAIKARGNAQCVQRRRMALPSSRGAHFQQDCCSCPCEGARRRVAFPVLQ